jgi:uncharacterized protein
LASYSTFWHLLGSLRGFKDLPQSDQWYILVVLSTTSVSPGRLISSRLQIHDTQEWHDFFQPYNNDELQLVLDRYLKDVKNDWGRVTENMRVLVGLQYRKHIRFVRLAQLHILR